MPQALEHRHFNPDLPVILRRDVTVKGRRYDRAKFRNGFDWRDAGLTPSQAEKLWMAGKIVHPRGAIAAREADRSGRDGLDDMGMNDLRVICEREGVDPARSKADTIAAIREARG